MSKFDNQSILTILEETFKSEWKKPLYSDYGTDTSYTYGEAAKNMVRLHAIFRQLGIRPGNRIAVCDKNSSRWAVATMAVMTYGAVVVPILSDFSVEQIHNIYEHSGAKLMICGPKLVEEFPDGMDITSFSLNNGTPTPPLKDYQKLKPSKLKFWRELDLNHPAVISYTSGSTGRSKGVVIPYRAVWSNTKFVKEYFNVPRGSNLMPLLPMSHMLGFAFEYMYGTCGGCHLHFLTKAPSPKIVLDAFQQVRPAFIVAVPLVIEKIVQTKVFPVLRTPSMRAWLKVPGVRSIIHRQIRKKLIDAFGGKIQQAVIGGAAFNKEVEDFLAMIKFPYSVGYGMTECAPLIAFDTWDKARKGSCGRVIHRMNLKVDSPDPQNVAGEIMTKGMNVMTGYYKNQEETSEAIDADGWLHTGDLGTIDKDGYLFIRGRKKTMLLGASGQNIYPEEIEDKIMTLTHFEECVVVQREEKLVALVYISEKSMREKSLTRDHLDRHLDNYRRRVNEQLPKFAQLSAMEIQDVEFEKTPKRSIRRYLYK